MLSWSTRSMNRAVGFWPLAVSPHCYEKLSAKWLISES
ncbi:hypothetical protein ADIWIN_2785 [Winogradskyella psychrotolerans RS-3]|uniref:Uncharacterized protein n=1 Tax=Winogradskyella psychrotolerans RS-3 TaxID=641526 RepID=S7VPW1_9FLAO|nr:hypothetical protein ADIWIN_2785 [Winogradskyella psychrotolerans RS-3]